MKRCNAERGLEHEDRRHSIDRKSIAGHFFFSSDWRLFTLFILVLFSRHAIEKKEEESILTRQLSDKKFLKCFFPSFSENACSVDESMCRGGLEFSTNISQEALRRRTYF